MLAGGSDRGLLFRITEKGKGVVLHEFAEDEVKALAVSGDDVYIGVNKQKVKTTARGGGTASERGGVRGPDAAADRPVWRGGDRRKRLGATARRRPRRDWRTCWRARCTCGTRMDASIGWRIGTMNRSWT